ncbi:hypothetical protein [Pseudomonas sp. OIL-1]|uniref:hypothetical protein n=1 Tax=Pseudomonas sp. OIL-1 TaxID=2706126 RepID=UPI002113A3AB|nr:hypothetical protein [Pseudomonas sp. OIL-1]
MTHTTDPDAQQPMTTSPEPPNFRGYLWGVAGGLVGAVTAFCLLLTLLDQTGNLPPPAFSNNLCADEKLEFLRANHAQDPNLLVMGSSVAWRHVDSNTLIEHAPGIRPLNGAFCGMHVNQSVYIADWLLEREPGIEQVVMLVDPIDFAGCSVLPDEPFDKQDIDAFVYGDAWRWQYYMRYFSPVSLLRNAQTVQAQRSNLDEMNPLVFNRFGDGPLNTRGSRGLFYGQPEPLDPVCFDALASMARRLQHEGKPFTIVTSPLNPDWKAKFDPKGELGTRFNQALAKTLGGTGARLWDGDNGWEPGAAAFIDAIHMRWSAAKGFTEALAEKLPDHRRGA